MTKIAFTGRYDVILDGDHFELILNEYTNPPVTKRNVESCMVRMGFPSHQIIQKPAFCLWYAPLYFHFYDADWHFYKGYKCYEMIA